MPQRDPQIRRSFGWQIVELVQTVVQMLLLFLLLSALLGRFEVHQISMEPNFHEGQRVIVSKLDGIWSSLFLRGANAAATQRRSPFAPQRGQIVIFFTSPDRTSDPLIKRVIGLPGDTIELRDGGVRINGVPLNEPYLHDQFTSCNRYCKPIRLLPGTYFLMGDNRVNSLDSRDFGPIPADQIVGRVVMRYWPLDKIAIYP